MAKCLLALMVHFSYHKNSNEDSCDADANSVKPELSWGVAGVVEAVLVLSAGRVGCCCCRA